MLILLPSLKYLKDDLVIKEWIGLDIIADLKLPN